tara:strand:- start:2933 stop:3655 length:723 start_codon:yes stop_codon:yes gene_type:complete
MSYFTRIPVGTIPDFITLDLNRALRYLPWIGLASGAICSLVFIGASNVLPTAIAALLTIGASGLITGFFHEDGFADTCDSFGAYTRENKLEIMKDSRIGVYGATGIWFLLTLKLVLLTSLPIEHVPVLLVLSHSISRLVPLLLISTLHYVSDNTSAKFKPVATMITRVDIAIGCLTLPLIMLLAPAISLISIFATLIASTALAKFGKRQFGGYTGDYLGFSQQTTEIMILLTGVIYWSSM